MDNFVLNAIVQEFQAQICPAKINNIFQPDDYSLVFALWRRGEERRLNISVDAQYQYLFLTPQTPPKDVKPFAKFLQCHIKNAEIRALRKAPLERILVFDIVKRDIDGRELPFQLILEIMGRYSNLILIHQESKKILDSLRHVTAAQSSYRRIAPGARYVPPPPQDKRDLRSIDRQSFQRLLNAHDALAQTSSAPRLWKFLLQHIGGISPTLAKEIEGQHLETSEDARWRRFSALVSSVEEGSYQPNVIRQREPAESGSTLQGKPLTLSAVPLAEFVCGKEVEIVTPPSMNDAAMQYYTGLSQRQRYERLKTKLLSPLTHRLRKQYKKREHLLAQVRQIAEAETYKRQGELITANLYQLKKGMTAASVIDYYSEEQSQIEITLDPRLTPSQNAQRYFKRYNKLKQGTAMTEQRLAETERDIAYLDELVFFVEDARTLQELERLDDEMRETTPAARKRPSKKTAARQKAAKPFLRFVSSDGFEIYVGRSSRENDLLTQRTAISEDIWLHVHHAPGSHVLILNRERKIPVPDETLREAAALAAYYSKLRNSRAADVNYTPRKYVKKPKGAPPGLVILRQFQTIRVAPRPDVAATPR